MPLYSWLCHNPECNHSFEQSQSLKDFDDKVEVVCPECGHKPAEREITKLRTVSSSWKSWRL